MSGSEWTMLERLVIVGSSSNKQPQPCPAGEMYLGGFHRACRKAAGAIAGPQGEVMVLSGLYGLVGLERIIEPYNVELGSEHSPVGERVVRQEAERLSLLQVPEVTVLASRRYAELVKNVWPDARTPLAGSRGIGEMHGRLAAIYG